MNRPAQKNWFRREGKRAEPPSASAGGTDGTGLPTKRIAAYTPAPSTDPSGNVGEDDAHDGPATTEAMPNRSAGEEVDAILQTAKEAAAKLTAAATEEAERTRAEANAAATRELETARSRAAADREHAAKERAEAEAYAARLRSEAEAAAEKVRVGAQLEASKLAEATQESARVQVGLLRVQAERHEERLEQLLAVARGITSEIEDVLEREHDYGLDVGPADQGRAAEPAHADLQEALQPNTSSETVA